MKKSIIAAALALCAFAGTASAEQAKAAEYRALLASGRYCVEYTRVAEYDDPKLQKRSDKYSKFSLERFVADGDTRAILSMGGRYGNEMAMRMENAKTVCKLFRNAASNAASLREDMKLDLLKKNGNYYQFFGKNKALRLAEAETGDPNADPLADWPGVKRTLAAPGFLAPFVLAETDMLQFAGSGTETIFGAPMATDTYLVRVRNKNDATDREYAYKYYYDEKGDLRYVGVSLATQAGAREDGANRNLRGKGGSVGTYIRIEQFAGTIPEGAFAYPEDYKVYAIAPGSLNDLFGYGELVESKKE